MKNLRLPFGTALLIGASCILNSCSKEQNTQPTPSTQSRTADVQVVNGRLVFADVKTYQRVREELQQKSRQQNAGQVLNIWENNLDFSSLRSEAALQSAHLEKLRTANQPTLAYDLMDKFGFPAFYAAIINPSGEYQIGTKIYWFNAGFKHEVNSEDELQQIKRDPSLSKEKSIAGSVQIPLKIANSKNVTTNQAVQSDQTDSYDKYVKTFNLNDDPGSARRIVYGTHIFSEYQNTAGGVATWTSALYLRVKLDYYSNGNNAWYPSDGESRQIQLSAIHLDGTVARETYESYGSHVVSDLTLSGYGVTATTNQDFSLGSTTVQAPRNANDANQHGYYPTSSAYIYWNYTITGYMNSYMQANFTNNYAVGCTSDGSPTGPCSLW